MPKWILLLPFAALLPLSCSSTSTNEGSGGAAGAGAGGTASGGAASGGTSSDAGGDGPVGLCPAGTADCDPVTPGCEQGLHCQDCLWVSNACRDAFKACMADNSCACDFACLRECARSSDGGPQNSQPLIDACEAGCSGSASANKVFECGLSEELLCCFQK